MPTKPDEVPAYIVPELRGMAVPIASLARHPRNPKQHDFAALRESFDDYGQAKPVVAVRAYVGPGGEIEEELERPVIVAGNGWHEMMELAGCERIAAVVTTMARSKAERFLLMDNQSQQRGGIDEEVLVEMLAELQSTEQGLAGTGYTDDLLKNMLDRMSGAGKGGEFQTVDADDIEIEYQCPRCSYRWSGKPNPDKVQVRGAHSEPGEEEGDGTIRFPAQGSGIVQ